MKIKDFIQQCQLTNAMLEYPKNTLVWAKIPKSYRDLDREVYQVQILSSDSDSRKYLVSYKDCSFNISFDDVVASQQQIDQMPIVDSQLSYTLNPHDVDDLVSAALVLNPQASSEDVQNLIDQMTSAPDSVSITLSSVEGDDVSVPTQDKFFNVKFL